MLNQSKLTKCVIYCRVSTSQQVHEGHGLDSQEYHCRQWAHMEGLEVKALFVDKGISGKDTANRQELNNMLAFLSKAKECYFVVFYDITRLSRDAGDFNMLRDIIEKQGHILATVRGKLEQTPAGRFTATIEAAHGQFWCEENAQKNLSYMHERARQGYWQFQPPWGYQFKKTPNGKELVAKEPEASIVRDAITGYATGRFANVVDVMNFVNPKRIELGYKPYNLTQVKEILESPKYTAHFAFRTKKHFDIPYQKWAHIEPLIDLTTHNMVKDRLNKRIRGNTGVNKKHYLKDDPDFPLKGFVLCPKCGYPLTGSRCKNRLGKPYPYYQCQHKGCENRSKMYISPTILHKDFEDLLHQITSNENYIDLARALAKEEYDRRTKDVVAQRKAKEIRLAQIEQEKQRVFNAFINASADGLRQMCEQQIENLTNEQTNLTQELESAPPEIMPFNQAADCVVDFIGNLPAVWEKGDLATKRGVLNTTFMHKISYDKESKFRTPELSPIFKMFSEFQGSKSNMVPVVGLEPTTY